MDNFKPKGRFTLQHYRNGKLIDSNDFHNDVTNEGKDAILDAFFHSGIAATTWYIGLIDSSGYTELSEDDTYDNINQAGNGWDEFEDYGTGDRIEWEEAAPSDQSVTNSANVATFDITGSGTVKGAFICGVGAAADTVGDHASDGVLWAAGLLTSDREVVSGDQLKITYTVNA